MLSSSQSTNLTKCPQGSQSIRQILLEQNLILSEVISHNSRVILELENVLKTYSRDYKASAEKDLPNPFTVNPLTQSSFLYQAKLKPIQPFPKKICKSKYFRITIELKTDPGLELLRKDRLELTAGLYTADKIPKKILHTMQGRNIFRGETTVIMAYDIVENKHLAHFKLQITEVSSHFVAGWFYLVIEAKQTLAFRGVQIKPMVVKNLKVRAKEFKN